MPLLTKICTEVQLSTRINK